MTARSRFDRRPGSAWEDLTGFSGDQERRLRAVCDDDGFIEEVLNIAAQYRVMKALERGALKNSARLPTVRALRESANTLADKLHNLPREIESDLGRGDGGYPDRYGLKAPLRRLIAKCDRAIAALSRAKFSTRNQASFAETNASARLCYVFRRHGLRYEVPRSARKPQRAADCLRVVFEAGARKHVALSSAKRYIPLGVAELKRRGA